MVAYFVHNLDSYSGAAQQALLLAEHVDKKIIIFNHTNKSYQKYNHNEKIIIVDLPKNSAIQSAIILFITITFRIKTYHFHGLFNVGIVIGAILRKKMILKTTLLGDDDFNTLRAQKTWFLRRVLLKQVDTNVVLSTKLKSINSAHIDVDKIRLIPNGVKIPRSCPTLGEKQNIFCFVGLVCARKRCYESIEYFLDNYSNTNKSKLYIVGPYSNVSNNNEFNDLYVNECFNLVRERRCTDKVIFTGRLKKEETHQILRISKALLFFSINEGMPNVVLEAMANNCVPIVSEMDGVMREIFEDGKQGFILDSKLTSINIIDIDNMIANKSPYLIAKSKFSIDKISLTYESLYEQ